MTHLEIAIEIGLYSEDGNVTRRVAEETIYYVLHGHDHGYGIRAYPGLIQQSELRKIDSIRRKEYGRKGGSAGAKTQIRQRKGIHGLSHEQKSEAGKKGAKLGLKAQGKTPYVKAEDQGYWFDEIEAAYLLSIHPSYQFQHGINKGKPNYREIAQILNEVYHSNRPIRTRKSLAASLFYYRRSRN